MISILRWLGLVGLVFGLGAGCTTVPETEDLDVSLVTVRSGEVTPWETTGHFVVRLQNAGPTPLVLEGGVHKIYLNGTYVGQGLSNERVEIPRLGTTTQTLTVHLKNFTLARKLYGASQTLTASYRIRSTLYVASGPGGRAHSIRAAKEGSLDLRELVPVRDPSGVTPPVTRSVPSP